MLKKKTVEVINVDGEGLLSFIGKRVLLMCANFYYEGVLEGVNHECVLLSDAGIVYSTGAWNEKSWNDRQQLPSDHYVMIQSIESFCKSPSIVLS
jgi:hypothetical protein